MEARLNSDASIVRASAPLSKLNSMLPDALSARFSSPFHVETPVFVYVQCSRTRVPGIRSF